MDNFLIFIIGLSGFAGIVLGLITWSQAKKSSIKLSFAVFAFFDSIWIFANFILQISRNDRLVKVVYALGALMIGAALIFLLNFIHRYSRIRLIFVICLSVIFFLLSFTSLIIDRVEKVYQTGYIAATGPAFILYSSFVSLSLVYYIISLSIYYKKNIGQIRYQAKYLLLGIGLFGLFSSFVSFILPLFDNWGYASLDSVSSLIFVAFAFYAIARHRLMDIRLVVKRVTVYLASLMSIVGIGFLAFWLGDKFFLGNAPYQLPGPIILLVGVVIFGSIKQLFEKIGNRYFFASLYDIEKTIQQLTKKLSITLHLGEVVTAIVDTINNAMKPEKIGLMLRQEQNDKQTAFTAASLINFDEKKEIQLVQNPFLLEYLQKTKQPLVYDEINLVANPSAKSQKQMKTIGDEMKHNGVAIILPLIAKDQIIGILLLGNKISHDAYTREDFKLLDIISSQAAIAVENALLYNNMQEVVDMQTKDIRDKTEHLKNLIELRSEFLDIASHQLRTPVSVINGTLSMLRDGDIDQLAPAEQKKFIDNIYNKGKKLESIISDILSASEMDSEDFQMSLNDDIDATKLLEHIVKNYTFDAEQKGLQLTFQKPRGKMPTVKGNEKYIEQALDNLVNNALHYTETGSITLAAKRDGTSGVIISVTDTGIGIPKDEKSKLFDKFVRARNARDMYTDGSGLGLFIIKRIMDAHPGGKVWVDSEEGKGSTFYLSLHNS